MRFFFKAVLIAIVLGAVGLGFTAYRWLHQPLQLTGRAPVTVDLSIEPGTSAKTIAADAVRAGVQTSPELLYLWFRLSGQSKQMKAGSYELDATTTPISLLNKLVRGEESLRSITLVEGWNMRQLRQALQNASQLQPLTQNWAESEIMQKIGHPGMAAEGRFFPDTYTYAKGSTDLALLARAARAMDKKLDAAWAQRSATTSLQSPEQTLILASIIEKETGRASDRPMIGAVFNNRLRIGMRLQTDPTVIYGLGAGFDGNLRKSDLQADTPWNTYTRNGLPPTPISMPGKASLLAAVQPANSNAIYFVARGDGTSEFSSTLEAHNRAVNKYQRGQ